MKPCGIAVLGCGNVGKFHIRSIRELDKARLVGAVERAGHDWVGQDVGVAMGRKAVGVTVTDDAKTASQWALARKFWIKDGFIT